MKWKSKFNITFEPLTFHLDGRQTTRWPAIDKEVPSCVRDDNSSSGGGAATVGFIRDVIRVRNPDGTRIC